MIFRFLTLLVAFSAKFIQVNCHGRLLVPPARSSAWREDPIKFPINYNDNSMFCGGFNALWQINEGKCGICGENYGEIKLYEKGGPLYRGSIVRTYNQGELISVVVEITSNHYGYFEFRLCNVDNLSGGEATQDCLNENVLSDSNGRTKIFIPKDSTGKIITSLKLPQSLSCNHCVLQWKYNGGNSWNTDPITGQSCVGCGPQEQFYGCADISIKNLYKREFKGYPQYFSPLSPSYPNGLVNQQGFNPISQKEVRSNSEYDRTLEEKTEISTSLLKRLVNELSSLRKYESESREQDRISNDLNLIERDVINDGGDPSAQEQHKHKDKTLN